MDNIGKHIDRFFEAVISFDKIYVEYAKHNNISYNSLCVLEAIYNLKGECTQKLICEKRYLPKQSVNVVIKELLNMGYIELKELPNDRRNKEIVFTQEGKKYANRIIGNLNKIEIDAFENFGTEKRDEMFELLKELEGNFRKSLEKFLND